MMKKLFVIVLLFTTYNFAQELNCTVTVNYQNLPVKNRDLLTDFKNVIEGYMNTTRFTNLSWDGDKIDCSLNIFFIGASSDVDYTAQIVVVSQRPIYKSTRNSLMLTINDGKWSFKYEVGQSMYANLDAYDPLTSLLDYYALIIIGFDMDTWEEYGGTPFFRKAYDIVNLAQSGGSRSGWEPSSSTYNRWGLVNDLLSEKYSKFRSAIFDYHYGLDIFSQNKEIGQAKMVEPIDVLWDIYKKDGVIKSVFVKVWFDAKFGEITDHLKDYPDKSIFNKLKKIDPSHTGRYSTVVP